MRAFRKWGNALIPTVMAGLMGGCGEGAPPLVDQFEILDSAGVVIAQSHGPSWGESQEGWLVNPEPLLTIGAESGDDTDLFSSVAGAVRLSDGEIVVADGASREL